MPPPPLCLSLMSPPYVSPTPFFTQAYIIQVPYAALLISSVGTFSAHPPFCDFFHKYRNLSRLTYPSIQKSIDAFFPFFS